MEKLEILKQKLSKRRKLAVGCLLGSVPVGAAMGAIGKIVGEEVVKQINLIKYQDTLEKNLMFVIKTLEDRYVTKYGLEFPRDTENYLDFLKANKDVYGNNFDYIYENYESAFEIAYTGVMYTGNVQEQAMQIGVGVGVASFLLVAGIPTAKYLICKRKIKKLEKELNENQEIEISA